MARFYTKSSVMESKMIEFVGLVAAAYRAATRRRTSKPLPYMSDYMLRDIGLTRLCVADGYGSCHTVAPFGPFGLPIVR